MNHVRFLFSDNVTVCSRPEILGHDFIVIDTSSGRGDSCKACSALLANHIRKAPENDLLGRTYAQTGHSAIYIPGPPEDHKVLRGIFSALSFTMIAFAIWVFIYAILAFLF